MMIFLIALHGFVTIAMIIVILLQKGETGGFGGSSSSQAMFSARGQANIFTKATAILATVFIVNCLLMTVLASYNAKQSTKVLQSIEKQ